MLSLLLIAQLSLKSLEPFVQIPIASHLDPTHLEYAHDAQFEYLATPAGLYRAPLAGGPLQRIAFDDAQIHAVAVDDGALYVLKGNGSSNTSPDHTLLRSTDHGATFTPIDAGLLDCAGEECRYLVANRIAFGPQHLFVNAGGNVLATADDGATWSLLHGLPYNGKPTSQICPVQFERSGERMILGGECPLDIAWLHAGTLRPDLLDWAVEPQPVVTPELENRNVQFIRDLGNGVVFAGIEGALLKSIDGGASFVFIIHHAIEDAVAYPYVGHLVRSSRDPELLVAGGFDKKDNDGYLVWSEDGGATWRDASAMVGASYVVLLAEDADGRMIIGLQHGDRITLAEVVLGARGKRRASGVR